MMRVIDGRKKEMNLFLIKIFNFLYPFSKQNPLGQYFEVQPEGSSFAIDHTKQLVLRLIREGSESIQGGLSALSMSSL